MAEQNELELEAGGIARAKRSLMVCKLHPHAREADLIEVTRRNGHKVKACRYCERYKFDNKKLNRQVWIEEKENLTDYYIRRLFVMGKGTKLDMQEYPKELVEAKRAVLKLKRAETDVNKTMKVCSKHGNLKMEHLIKAGKNKSGKQQYKCKPCLKEFQRNHYQLNKLAYAVKTKEWRANNIERKKELDRKYRQEHRDHLRERNRITNKIYRIKHKHALAAKSKMHKGKARRALADPYIRRLLCEGTGLRAVDITPELIELKRTTLQIKKLSRAQRGNDKLKSPEIDE